jgi:ethanolamine utilization protein EutN
MYVGRVSGTVVATIKNELFEGRKLLVVDRQNLHGQPTGKYDIAVDMVQAGVGDMVLIVGIVDQIDVEGSGQEP